MISPLIAVRSALFHAATWPSAKAVEWFVRHRNDFTGSACSQVGKAQFFGTPEFAECGQRAMERLRELDKEVFEGLASTDVFTFWLIPMNLETGQYSYRTTRFYGVSPKWLAWREEGLISFLVHVHFSRRVEWQQADLWSMAAKSGFSPRERTAAWLREQKFPAPLVAKFGCKPEAPE